MNVRAVCLNADHRQRCIRAGETPTADRVVAIRPVICVRAVLVKELEIPIARDGAIAESVVLIVVAEEIDACVPRSGSRRSVIANDTVVTLCDE